jgi:hypothetical protein
MRRLGGSGLTVEPLGDLTIRKISDLTPYLVGDEYILPAGLIILANTLNLVDKAIRLSSNTILRGLTNATLISSAPNGVVRVTNVDSPVILREFNVVATAGACFNLTGTITHQLNMFFVGMIGVKAAIITGFNVQSFKQCYIEAADGITFDGTTNKIFVSESPFYGIVGSAMTLASTLVADVADIVTCFYKFDSPGVGLTAQAGYNIREGLLRGSLRVGNAVPLSGLAASNLNWNMTDNSGIANSRIVGGLYLTASVETVITTINTPVKVLGTTTPLAINERFISTVNNRITYVGIQPTVGMFTGTYAIAAGNNAQLAFYIAKNGVLLTESISLVRVGTGADERAGTVIALLNMVNGDYVEIFAENKGGTGNLTCLSLNLNGIG